MRDDHILPLPELDTWRNDAACRGHDTALWFDPTRQAEGLAICDTCPVRHPCRTEGAAEEGIWGGRPEGARYAKPGTRVGTLVDITCAECGRTFVRVTTVGVAPIVCGPRCRKDRDLRNARRARERRKAS